MSHDGSQSRKGQTLEMNEGARAPRSEARNLKSQTLGNEGQTFASELASTAVQRAVVAQDTGDKEMGLLILTWTDLGRGDRELAIDAS